MSTCGTVWPETTTATTADPLPKVPPELVLTLLSRLPPNEVALSVRRTCRAAAQHFAEEHHRTAAIGQPLSPHAASGPLEEAEAAMHSLSFRHKLRTLSVAAASGSVVNLEVAWRLLQPCIFQELLQTTFYLQQLQRGKPEVDDPGTAAAKRGSVGALSWLLDRCPGLVYRPRTLEAAAKHCPLPQLQEAWAVISAADGSQRLDGAVLAAAAESPMPDAAIAKMEWVLQQGGSRLTVGTAAAAARSGDLARLRWLRERGCPLDSWQVLEAELRHADLSVAEWLVDEAGCPLPEPDAAGPVASAAAATGVAKLQWLQERGVNVSSSAQQQQLLMNAAGSGNTEAMRFVLEMEGGAQLLNVDVMNRLVSVGNVTAAAYLKGEGCPVDQCAWSTWYKSGCKGGQAMLRWLLQHACGPASSSVSPYVIAAWPDTTAADSRQLLEALRLLLPPGSSGGLATRAILHAARRGDLALLRYLHEELGGELGPSVLAGAARGGCEAMLEWLVERGCAAGVEARLLDDCYLEAGQRGNLAALECLRRLGVPWSEGLLLKAVAGGVPVPVFHWLRGQGARMSKHDLQEAARLAGAQREEDSRRRAAKLLEIINAEGI